MESAIYSGTLMHSRYVPFKHSFVYKMKMILLNLDELDTFFAKSSPWVRERFGLVSFKRSDYLPDENKSVKEAVLQTVKAKTGIKPEGPVFMLANLRYWGLQFNPASFFYCFEKSGGKLTHVVIEVHNTPWNERHRYVLPMEQQAGGNNRFKKTFHVSPFNPMDMSYSPAFTTPDEKITAQLENYKDDILHFKAVLKLKKENSGSEAMAGFARNAWKLPFKIVGGIYWQAFKLFLKRAPYYPYSKERKQ